MNITRENSPCRYYLSWDAARGLPLLFINKQYSDRIPPLPSLSEVVVSLIQEFGFQSFHSDIREGESIGFDKALEYAGLDSDGFYKYVIPVHKCRELGGPCPHCNAMSSSYREFDDGPCLGCDGSTRVSTYDYSKAFAVAASLNVILQAFDTFDVEFETTSNQLMDILVDCSLDPYFADIHGSIGIEVANFLRKQKEGELDYIVDAMKTVWSKMDDVSKKCKWFTFQAQIVGKDGWFILAANGDCTMFPNRHSMMHDQGFEIGTQHVDNPMQQMCMIAALAALQDLVRTSLNRTSR